MPEPQLAVADAHPAGARPFSRDQYIAKFRTLIWNQHHRLRALREFEEFYNGHRPHQGIANARPLCPLPPPITDPDQIARLDIRRRQRLGGILNEYKHAV